MKELRPWAQDCAVAFENLFGSGNCSCHINAPCSSCTHEGNPRNLEDDPRAWGDLHEVMALEAEDSLTRFIDALCRKNLAEMKSTNYSKDRHV